MNREIQVTDSIVDSVIDKFVERAAFGKKKYGLISSNAIQKYYCGV